MAAAAASAPTPVSATRQPAGGAASRPASSGEKAARRRFSGVRWLITHML